MNSSLELDNEDLRQKLQELRKTNSKLITENHRLTESLEELNFQLKNSSSKVTDLEESLQSYRSKTLELSGALTSYEKVSRSSDKDCQTLREQYKECSQQLAESADLLWHQSESIQALKQELDELKISQERTEADRNLALDMAEQIQQSYDELQKKFKKAVSSSEDEIGLLRKEQRKLVEDLESRHLRVDNLHEEVKKLRTEIAAQKNLRHESEQRNADLRSQLKHYTAKIDKLEQELDTHKKFKVKNAEMKIVMEQQRKRISLLESEIQEVRRESLSTERNSVRGKKGSKTELAEAKKKIEPSTSIRSEIGISTDDLKSKLLMINNHEIMQLRADICRLSRSIKAEDGDAVSEAGQDPGKLCVHCDGGETGNKLQGYLVDAVDGLDKRLAMFEARNSSSEALVDRLNSQIVELKKVCEEKETEKVSVERELQKRIQQIRSLENQLNDKVKELGSKVSEVKSMKSELELSKVELEMSQRKIEEKNEEYDLIMSDISRLNQLHSEHCVELEGQMAFVEKRYEDTRLQLEQSETQCNALQQMVNQTMGLSSALKEDLRDCRQMASVISELEQDARKANGKVLCLEQELNLVKEKLAAQVENAQDASKSYFAEMSEKNMVLKSLEERLMRTEEERSCEVEEVGRLLKELDANKECIQEQSGKMDALEQDKSALLVKLEHLQESHYEEMCRLTTELEDLEARLQQALVDLENKEFTILELETRRQEMICEKERTAELLLKLKISEQKMRALDEELKMSREKIGKQEEEVKVLNILTEERQSTVSELQDRLVCAQKELLEKSRTVQDLCAEGESQKVTVRIKDSQLAEAAKKMELQNMELKQLREQLDAARLSASESRNELRQRKVDIEGLHEKLRQKDWELQQRANKIARLELALDERQTILRENEHRLLRVEDSLQKNQLNAEQNEKLVGSLEDQLHDLLAMVKDQCLKIQKNEIVIRELDSEIDARKVKASEQEKKIDGLNHELQRMTVANGQAEDELRASREHLQKMQLELTASKQEAASTRFELDRLAKDLSEAANLLKEKDAELAKLLKMLYEAEACRSRYSSHVEKLEKNCERLQTNYSCDISSLKKAHEEAMSERDREKQRLVEELDSTVRKQQHLSENVMRLVTQVTRLQKELEANRVPKGYGSVRTSAQNLDLGSACEEPDATGSIQADERQGVASPDETCSDFNRNSNQKIDSISGQKECLRSSENTNGGYHHQHPEKVSSVSSRIPGVKLNQGSLLDILLYQDSHSSPEAADYASLSSTLQGDDDMFGGNFFQNMWKLLRNADKDNLSVSSGLSNVCPPEKKSHAIRICSSVPPEPSKNHAGNNVVADNSARAVVVPGVPVSGRTALETSEAKRKTLSVTKQTVNPDAKRPHHGAYVPKKTSSVNSKSTPAAESNLGSKKSKRMVRSQSCVSPISPIFASRHSPDPTTAVSFYGKLLPASTSDSEVDTFLVGDGVGYATE